ncbi:MAG: hypothetical protein R3Y58_01680 [Eubacteriales bacterium]
MNEKAYKVMSVTGIGNIAIGIVMIVIGIAAGTIAVISGVKLIKEKRNLIF